MPRLGRADHHVCAACLLKYSGNPVVTRAHADIKLVGRQSRPFSNLRRGPERPRSHLLAVRNLPGTESVLQTRRLAALLPLQVSSSPRPSRQFGTAPRPFNLRSKTPSRIRRESFAARAGPPVNLSSREINAIAEYRAFAKELRSGFGRIRQTDQTIQDAPLDEILKHASDEGVAKSEVAEKIKSTFPGKSYLYVKKQLDLLKRYHQTQVTNFTITDQATKKLLTELGVVDAQSPTLAPPDSSTHELENTSGKDVAEPIASVANLNNGPLIRVVPSNSIPGRKGKSAGHVQALAAGKETLNRRRNPSNGPQADVEPRVIEARSLALIPIEAEHEQPPVPRLSFDLARVLFNPGIYQLQDPRSRVWNFDPYLGKPMAVSEFNYDALGKYVTSSEDNQLLLHARKHQKQYAGSTSSMTSTLAHFHYLLSAWRDITVVNLSKGFREDSLRFTQIQTAPAAMFLRWRDGVYGIDADKEWDSGNILMTLGRSLEKLLTMEKNEFEQFRKTNNPELDAKFKSKEQEAYHYTALGDFMMRSQLDAHDPRLPGTGVFDLKTRAVAAVRMMLGNHEEATGYQIKQRYGDWESYEREYYDMIRAAFLKYSLQVRMGRMDGIFVAYHNIERIFGFQYISLPEMDLALHGQTDVTLGHQEFCTSVTMLNEIFDKVTASLPEQSLRFHFETREPSSEKTAPFMYVFAEPVTEDEIHDIQRQGKDAVEAYERRIFHGQSSADSEPQQSELGLEDDEASEYEDEEPSSSETVSSSSSSEPAVASNMRVASLKRSNAEDVDFVDSIIDVDLDRTAASAEGRSEPAPSNIADASALPELEAAEDTAQAPAEKKVLGWKVIVRNHVNGLPVARPTKLTRDDNWKVEYDMVPLTEAETRRHYTLCKNRRRVLLSMPQESDAAVSYYIQRLVSMSQGGRAWRRQMDDYDAQREQVVLYGDRIQK